MKRLLPLLLLLALPASGATIKPDLVAIAGEQVCTAGIDGVTVRRAESAALEVLLRKGAAGARVKLEVEGDVITRAHVPRIRNRIRHAAQVDTGRCEWILPDPPPAPSPTIDLQALYDGAGVDAAGAPAATRWGLPWATIGAYIVREAKARICPQSSRSRGVPVLDNRAQGCLALGSVPAHHPEAAKAARLLCSPETP